MKKRTANWTLESSPNLNIEKEMVDIMSKEIQEEIDNQLLDAMQQTIESEPTYRWWKVIMKKPQYIKHCKEAENFTGYQWDTLVRKHPQLEKYKKLSRL